ncbi:thioredoxin family protein [Bacteroidia bacterium]|nr:thioredoxin family protein [Bacteroidia bacterium]
MEIKVLGGGCHRCKQVYDAFCRIAKETGADAIILKIEDLVEILKYNAPIMPAVIIDEVVATMGRIPSDSEIRELLGKK